MTGLPVIVGFGGYNAAGRSSFHQFYQRTIIESLSLEKRQETLVGLATMTGLIHCVDGQYRDHTGHPLSMDDIDNRYQRQILEKTLIRRISNAYFDVDNIPSYQKTGLSSASSQGVHFDLPKHQLPKVVPSGWQVSDKDNDHVHVVVPDATVTSSYAVAAKAAGQLPDGFDPASLYASRFHPRGLQLSIIGASDAVNSMGIPWETVLERVSPDQIGVYSSSIMSQLDDYGMRGLLQARLRSNRVSAKQLVLGLGSMPADFINAYVLGSVGATGSIAGACASFLYNLQAGMDDIRSGRCKVVIVGTSEAPITPEIIDGYATMGALATDEKLCRLDGGSEPDYRRASRPFGENCGFTIAESTQYVVLMNDDLAMEIGATVHGSVLDVWVNADGFKKSISSPGAGNYLTMARAVASARNLLGDEAIRRHSFIQAHGSSTPQNRVSESEIFDRIARAFGINNWPVTALKSYIGHSLASAGGDQLIHTLGIFNQRVIPGIKTIDKIADDVAKDRLHLCTEDVPYQQSKSVAFLNAKGFGGNNATACILSPQQTEKMLEKRYGSKKMLAYRQANESVVEAANQYHVNVLQGDFGVRYHFGKQVLGGDDIELTDSDITVAGFEKTINIHHESLYKNMV